MAYRAFFTSLISFSVLFFSKDLSMIHSFPLARVTLGSLFGVMGLFSMLIVIQKAPLQWMGIYSLIGVVFTAFYLYFFENLELEKSILGIVLIVCGFIFYLIKNRETGYRLMFRQHLLLTSMIFCYGASSIIHWKNLGESVPPVMVVLNQELVVLFFSLIATLMGMELRQFGINLKRNFSGVVIMALVIFLGLWCSFLGLKATNPLISSVMFLANPLITIFFGTIFFKEKLSLSNAAAIVVISLGSFLIHYGLG